MAARRIGSKSFLGAYRIESDPLLGPKPVLGRPGLQPALDPDGRSVLVKFWDRAGKGRDADLEQIWRSEIRQLQRLAAVPRAEELFVPMVASGEDDQGFYLVLDPGQTSPLEVYRRGASQPAVMTQYRLPRSRRRLWANAKRAAEGLGRLYTSVERRQVHSQAASRQWLYNTLKLFNGYRVKRLQPKVAPAG